MDEETHLKKNPEDIQQALAEARSSLRESIAHIEKEAERRVIQTMDQVQNRILEASEDISRTITRPIHAIQEKIERVPQVLRSKPFQTLAVTVVVAATAGFVAGRRQANRRSIQRALPPPAPILPQERYPQHLQQLRPGTRGFLSTILIEATHQILLTGFMSLMRRRK